MKKQNVRTLSLIVATITYLLIGAAIFDSIESEEEQRQKEALTAMEQQIRGKYNISQGDFPILEEVVLLLKPYKAGQPWAFAGSFYYATTVLTTIGYGHSTPKTIWGRMFTMLYASFGIPLGLIMFNSIGERLNRGSSMIIDRVRRSVGARQEETTEVDLILVVLFLSVIIWTTGAVVFSSYEKWEFFDALYYCFATLTTIGFGDLVALQQDESLTERPEYVAFALFFIVFGLAVIAAVLNLMLLKFMTMNTEDENRDEIEAQEAARMTVKLDGDIIMGEIAATADRRYPSQGFGSLEDVGSVCSCTCTTCHPYFFSRDAQGRRGCQDFYSDECRPPERSRAGSVHEMRAGELGSELGEVEMDGCTLTRTELRSTELLLRTPLRTPLREEAGRSIGGLSAQCSASPAPSAHRTLQSPAIPAGSEASRTGTLRRGRHKRVSL